MKVFHAVLVTECRNILRNKRALLGTFIPIIVIPIIMFITGGQLSQFTSGNNEDLKIAVVNESTSTNNDVADFINSKILTKTMRMSIEKKDKAVKKVKNGDKDLMIMVSDNDEKKEEKEYRLIVVYSNSSIKSSASASVILARIDSYNDDLKEEFLKQYGEDYYSLDVIPYESVSISDYTGKADVKLNPTLALIMPMLILVFVINGGSGISVDLFAGEKERGSLEALLTTRADRKYILLAKLVTAVAMSVITSVLTAIGYSVAMISSIGGEYNYPIGNYIYLLLTTLFTAFMAAAANCYISITAQTTREAHSKVTIFCILPTIVGAFNMFAGTGTVPRILYAVPFLNSFYLFSDAYSSAQLSMCNLIIAFASSVAVVGILIVLSVDVLNKEKVLIGKQRK